MTRWPRFLAGTALVLGCLATPLRADSMSSEGLSWTFWSPLQNSFKSVKIETPAIVRATPRWSMPAPAAPVSTPIVPPAPIVPIVVPNVPPTPPAPVASPIALTTAPYTPPQPAVATLSFVSAAPTPAPAAMIPPQTQYDAYVNMGSGPYSTAESLTTGSAQPWYASPAAQGVFNGVPNANQRAAFTDTVLQRVEHTYQLAGIPIRLTSDSNAAAAHTVSVVSGTSYPGNPDAAGMTSIGHDGFSFIDKFGAARTVDELEWVVAHNVAHELMHAFGADHHDTSGEYLDSAVSGWDKMIDPNTTFGPDAISDLLVKNFQSRGPGYSGTGAHQIGCTCTLCRSEAQLIAPAPIPEPATIMLWSLIGAGGLTWRIKRQRPI